MESFLKELNLIDLISEKHAKLRKMVRDAWVEKGEEEVTDTESYMLAIIERERITVAQIARKIGISRQGAHKCAQGLIGRGYIEIKNQEENSRDKVLILTGKGLNFMKETLLIKERLEVEIKEAIGTDNFYILKESLNKSWFE